MQELTKSLVPAGDQIERTGKSLADGANDSFEARLVQSLKKQSHEHASYQGVYVATPSGMLLAGTHHDARNARKVEALLRKGLKKWKSISRADRLMTGDVFAQAKADLAKEMGRNHYPEDGLVLSVICRDLPRPELEKASPVHRNQYNQDYAWFRKSEARALLPEVPSKGDKHHVPRKLVERLARFHFVDLARGHTLPYPQVAVERAILAAEVIEVKKNLITLRYTGATRTSEVHDGVHQEGKWNRPGPGIPELQRRGVKTKLQGHAVYDQKTEKFVSFEMVGVASRWGGNAYNARLQYLDFGPAPMGFVLSLPGDHPAERLPPLYFQHYSWDHPRLARP